ncbi:Uu.00g088800.m01.CDS01 [Anthostomella pinea]|uniref:Uu.00g088800.m01.CDS01 n=1 Tax=Anthostomella pinea TaxID=933095 RepID=A0AAI8YHQ4_9PEZI|nr:Uu.00g088800.m01.CDS01 [Anthostomella pinea]
MSVTTTENPVSYTLQNTLQDYEVQVDGACDLPQHHWVPLRDREAPEADNPPDWPTDERRGMPRYRPINYELDTAQRPWGANPIGTAFVATMFTGVWIQATASWVWRKTGGRFNDTYFRYQIGGEV